RTGPLPTVAVPTPAVRHFFGGAPPLAFIGSSTSLAPCGIVTDEAEPTPGGLYSGRIVIGAVKPALRSATILRFIEPFCTSGAFGSTMLIVNGTSSVTATASRSTSCFQ